MPTNPDRWQKIEELYHAALEREPAGRAEFLDIACGPDLELRNEVGSLLTESPAGSGVLDRRVGEFLSEATDATDPKTLALEAGTRLGPYQIEGLIGEGGMGKVYRTRDPRLGRTVAIKTSNARFSEQFEREARTVAALNHPHICQIYDVGPDYLVMEFIDGRPLKGPLPVEQALQYGEQICDALDAAHQKGIVHRDLKPTNIMISKQGAKLLDFGLARVVTEGAGAVATGPLMGTPAYMAPELWGGARADARSDIYAFGCVLYEVVTGTLAVADRMISMGRGGGFSRELERIVSKCLESDPDLRYQHASEIGAELRRLQREIEPAPVAASVKSRLAMAVSAATALIAMLVAGYFYFPRALHGAPRITDKDTIVLADFTNTTGDPVFDETLRQGLAIQLQQSPFLKIMDDGQVQQDLRLMRLPAGTRITSQIAHDICVRDAAAATINGSIASLGRSYAITVQAITCHGGVTLAREQIQAPDKERVLSAVGTAATGLRGRLGESRSSIQNLNRPLEQATTGSLEALQAYTAGYDQLGHGRYLAANELFERAIALDPKFATAYHYLSIAAINAGDAGRAKEYDRKALALIDRVSEYEREWITADYYKDTGELDKALNAFRLGVGNYPREWGFHNDISLIQMDLGEFEEGLKEGEAAAELQPSVEPPYRRLLDAYICLDRLDEARKVAERVRAQKIDGARIHQRFLEMAYIEGDDAGVAKETLWYAGKPEEYISFGLQAAHLNVLGKRRESGKFYKRAAATALRQGLTNVSAGFEEADARADALAGNCRTVRRLGRPALELAMCGDAALAEKLAEGTSKRYPNGTVWNSVQLPEISAAAALQRGEAAKAVEVLESASHYERAYPGAVYLRGLAYLRLHRGAEAAAEFRKIVDHKGASWGSTWFYPNWGLYYSLSYAGLGRASALAGDTRKAKKAFDDFFALWKQADPDLPFLIEARKDYAALR